MAVSGLIIALASNYLMYMVGRAMIGVAIGGFWSMSAATAICLVPQHQVTRALAISCGNALATVVAAPLEAIWGLRSDGEASLSCAYRGCRLYCSVLVCPAWMRIKATRHLARYSAYLAAAWSWSA